MNERDHRDMRIEQLQSMLAEAVRLLYENTDDGGGNTPHEVVEFFVKLIAQPVVVPSS
jgi:hypothetical protein